MAGSHGRTPTAATKDKLMSFITGLFMVME